ncbi:PIN domain-containing protein [Streptomyces spiramyceticus]|uniref:PIN domain-containing protein n=1 Tax=Streptomyces spiramyceticus TaxID=299717 RepID=UPI00237B4461|nr:PIN domain-containing protein [Streptomyces spiramyceticus]
MIILDTCTIRSAGLRSSSADLLRTIRRSGVERVAVPWIAMEELAAQKSIEYLAASETAIRALEALEKASPWDVPKVGALDPEGVREHWRQQWGEIVTVLPTSLAAMQKAMMREANVLPPCKLKTDGSKNAKPVKIGGRDAAIWLTAVEYAREHPDETVYFVSENHKDFTDGVSGYPYPMDQDLDGIEGRFVHLTSLNDLVARFAKPTDVDEARVAAACDLPDVQEVVADDAYSRWTMLFDPYAPGFECTWASPEGSHTGWASGWLDLSGVKVRRTSLTDVNAYRIGDHVWATANVGWELGGFTLLDEDEFVHAVTHYDTRVLVSLQDGDTALTVIRGDKPRAVDYDISTRGEGEPIDGGRMKRALNRLQSHIEESLMLTLDQLVRDYRDQPSTARLRNLLIRALNERGPGVTRLDADG